MCPPNVDRARNPWLRWNREGRCGFALSPSSGLRGFGSGSSGAERGPEVNRDALASAEDKEEEEDEELEIMAEKGKAPVHNSQMVTRDYSEFGLNEEEDDDKPEPAKKDEKEGKTGAK